MPTLTAARPRIRVLVERSGVPRPLSELVASRESVQRVVLREARADLPSDKSHSSCMNGKRNPTTLLCALGCRSGVVDVHEIGLAGELWSHLTTGAEALQDFAV